MLPQHKMPRQIIYAILSWFYQLTICSRRIYFRAILIRRFHQRLFLSSGWIPMRRDGSHLIFMIARRFLNGQTEPGAAKTAGWVGQYVAVLHVGPRSSPRDLATDPLWFLLIPSLSPRRGSPLSPLHPVPPVPSTAPVHHRSGYPFLLFDRASVKRGIASTINDLHHRTGHHHRSSSKAPLMT